MLTHLTKFLNPRLLIFPVLCLKLAYPLHTPQGSRRLDLYRKIKQKQMKNIKNNELSQQSIEKYYKQYRCDGCNSTLQSEDKHKYGFIKLQALDSSVKSNIKLIENTYGDKVSKKDSKTLEIINQIQQEMGVKIFNNRTKKLDNLDNVQILLRLQQKIDKYQQQQQTIKRIKKQRHQLYCQRCYSLKYHNKLPQQYDLPQTLTQNNQQQLMDKVFKKHKNAPTFYIYLIDVLDIAGSFKKYVFDRLIQENVDFCIVINKLDILNEKYLNKYILVQVVRQIMMEFISDRDSTQKQQIIQKLTNTKIHLIRSTDRPGLKPLSAHLEANSLNRIQILGFPNTGKTTLLNQLAKSNKPTSKVPGTTLYITQHHHNKNIFYDMPGMYAQNNLYNLIDKPNLKAILTWNKFYSPPVLLHQAFFFGGKVEIKDVKIILFGMGGSCSSDNRWFILNHKLFWKGMPPLNQLNMQKHILQLSFQNGKTKDLEIAGWGFICFRLATNNLRQESKQLTLYLPKGVQFRLRESILKDSEVINYKSVMKKRYRLERVHQEKRKEIEKK